MLKYANGQSKMHEWAVNGQSKTVFQTIRLAGYTSQKNNINPLKTGIEGGIIPHNNN
jgi:hypothetical protein